MKLASVEKIVSIAPIDGADMIEKSTVLGWDIVTKKGEFKVGDLAAYIQIDTIVPATEQFEFLSARDYRVRTIKLRKQISQGLLVPLPEGKWKEGDDLTEILGVKKYSKDKEIIEETPRMPKKWYKKYWWIVKHRFLVKLFPGLKKVNRSSFPKNLIPITDEERIQNIPSVLEKYKGKQFVIAEKLDGSSITIIHEKSRLGKSRFRVCSRRFELFNKNNEWHQVFFSTNFEKHILSLVKWYGTNNIMVQGEFIGKPQGNKYQLKENEIRLFNIYVDGKRLAQSEFYDVCKQFNIPCCPHLDTVELDHSLSSIISFAEGKSVLNKNTEREGLVFRCIEDNLSFKVISNKYLLKNNE